MSRANEIYNYQRSIQREIENLQSDINKDTILRYHHNRIAEGMSFARQHKCINTLELLSKILGKKFEKATKDDIVRLVATIEQKPFSVWTKRDYKIILKKFYQWLYNCEEGYPAVVKWIKAKNSQNSLKKSDLLTPEEIKKLVESAVTLRDKALIRSCLVTVHWCSSIEYMI